MEAYIPPHARKISSNPESNSLTPVKEARTPKSQKLNQQHPLYTVNEIHSYFWNPEEVAAKSLHPHHATLNAAAATPETLRYLMLFFDAHPRWKLDQIIFVKSDLHLLGIKHEDKRKDFPMKRENLQTVAGEEEKTTHCPGEEKISQNSLNVCHSTIEEEHDDNVKDIETEFSVEEKACSTVRDAQTAPSVEDWQINHPNIPIAVFEQTGGQKGRSIRFGGYFTIKRVDYLLPKSEQLVRMLHQKWDPFEQQSNSRRRAQKASRDPEAWAKSLSVPWAVVQFEKLEKTRGLQDPNILVDLSEDEKEVKSGSSKGRNNTKSKTVNELLQEMRLKDGET